MEEVGIGLVSHMVADEARIVGSMEPHYYVWDSTGTTYAKIMSEPEVFEYLRDDFTSIAGIDDIYGEYIKTENGWHPIESLAYGHKRALLMMYLARKMDLLVIEGFEAGLHLDLIVNMLQWLEENAKNIIVETHSGLALKKALDLGWNTYYVDGGHAYRLSVSDLQRTDLFEKEVRALLS